MRLARTTVLPEDSVPLRVVVALGVEVGIVAVVLAGAVDGVVAVCAIVLAPVGYLFSYRHRARTSFAVKAMLTVGLVLALAAFLRSFGAVRTVDEARIPLATLFLWVQVLHAFDVPRRRDLAFSMVSSTTLIAVAGAIALSGTFVWLLLAWAGLAATWLWLSASPRADQVVAPVATRWVADGHRRRLPATRSAAVAGLAAVVLGTAVFAVMPRLPARLIRTPPFTLGGSDPAAADADRTVNPGLPAPGVDGVVDFAPGAYPGFSGAMDLRARGQLSEDLAFRVRAEQAALWRAEVFDTFDGRVWTASDTEQTALDVTWYGSGLSVPLGDFASAADDRRSTQTFYLESDQPNVLFGANRIDEVFFPAGGLEADRYGTVRTPILLEAGIVYSVTSEVPEFDPAALALLGDPSAEGQPALARYLQLPEATSERVRDLGATITAGSRNAYERAIAVQDWLRANTAYDLGVPREPDGVDAVDHFLFETRRGFCEHIASAMVVLLRASGVPSRIATGYGPGDRNPLTGYLEVRASDAHAWVEVLIPGMGWMTFDPTFGVPPAQAGWGSLVGAEMIAAVGRAISGAVPQAVRSAVGDGARAVAGVVRTVWPLLVAGAAAVAIAFLRKRRRRARDPGPPDEVGRAFEELVAALAVAGHPRDPATTPRELLDEVVDDPDMSAEIRTKAALVVGTFERTRFADPRRRPGEVEVMRAAAAAARVRSLVGTRR